MLKDIYLNLIIDLNDYRSIKTSNKQELINKILDYIQDHYMETISLSTVARTVFLSPSYLSTLITNETGKSFTDIVNEIRISKAIELLKNPKRKIADIAFSVGFNEPQYFSIIFKSALTSLREITGNFISPAHQYIDALFMRLILKQTFFSCQAL